MDYEEAHASLFPQDDTAPVGPWWLDKAQERFAAGHHSTLDAAVWSVTYQEGYRLGLRDAHDGGAANADCGTMGDGYRAGYLAGRRWGLTHPRAALERDARTRARHCEQAHAGYFYCEATPGDPCGPGRYPHDGHAVGQCGKF